MTNEWRKVEVEIEGTSPLLMHSAEGMTGNPVKKNPAQQYNAVEDAEKVAYRNKSGELFIPARCIKACIVNGSSWYKIGKKSAKPIIAGCTRIEPYDVGLGTKKYEVDLRPVVIQKSRIMRARPRLDSWKVKFDIVYNSNIIPEQSLPLLRKIIK